MFELTPIVSVAELVAHLEKDFVRFKKLQKQYDEDNVAKHLEAQLLIRNYFTELEAKAEVIVKRFNDERAVSRERVTTTRFFKKTESIKLGNVDNMIEAYVISKKDNVEYFGAKWPEKDSVLNGLPLLQCKGRSEFDNDGGYGARCRMRIIMGEELDKLPETYIVKYYPDNIERMLVKQLERVKRWVNELVHEEHLKDIKLDCSTLYQNKRIGFAELNKRLEVFLREY